ncbi:MAG: glycosyltransferase family 2 protein [Gemmatimonadetes bacterium]|nr:glycosyltransferase family 2 protein [Gemmatimonadota bacterium]
MPQVSVVVPLYNKEPYVRRALDSIAAQSFADFEVVIVDDGSQDGSAAIAAGYPDSRFRMIRQANAGPGAARNRGIAEAKGEWIAFLDADDEWLPDYLELAVRQFRSLGEDVASVSSGYYDFHGPGTPRAQPNRCGRLVASWPGACEFTRGWKPRPSRTRSRTCIRVRQ